MNATQSECFDTAIAGGGIAGLVTALELLRQGQQRVVIIDRDSKERLGGLARWAFGGMALSGTAQQKRAKISDGPTLLLSDWHSFAEFGSADHWPKQWAQAYAEQNYSRVYLWLKALGCRFLPAVNWVERGLYVPGNSVPRYHVLWGTGWHLVENIIAALQPFIQARNLVIYHQHQVIKPTLDDGGKISGVQVKNQQNAAQFTLAANNVVIACGGINGSLERVKQNWCASLHHNVAQLLNGANPISDGKLHDEVARLGAKLTHLDKMWNYAAGIPHPQAEFEGHGLSLIPCKSALWLDHSGKRIGPVPLITGFDTHFMCQQVARQEQPWTWQLLNWRIAAKELAVSGSMHNPSIKNKNWLQFLKEIVFGNHRLIRQLAEESDDFLVADTLELLVEKMNGQTDQSYIELDVIKAQLASFDTMIKRGDALQNDDQLRRIIHARQWTPDRLRTCKPGAMVDKNAGPLIAIKVQLISRKSLGGIQTNLQSQVLDEWGNIIHGLYGVGEAAGFGGGGANGKRSLEGTFLSACILTARNAADAIMQATTTNNTNEIIDEERCQCSTIL